jgi:photosystem II stability/assembly factor-like uncharacterized protein
LLLVAVIAYSLFTAHSSQPTWQPHGLGSTIVHFLAPEHHHAGRIFAASGNGVYRADAAGRWRRVLSTNTAWSVYLLPDDRTVLAGDEAGNVDVSRDAGAHWTRHEVSPDGVYAVTASPTDPRLFLAGAGGGLYRSDDGGRSWQRRLALRQSAGAAFTWLQSTSGSRSGVTVFAGAVAGGTSGAAQVYVSHDSGLHWKIFGQGLQSLAGIMSLAATPTGYVYAGTMGNRVWRVRIGGAPWAQASSGIPAGQHGAAIAIVPGRGRRGQPELYVGTLGRGVFLSRDGSAHWTAMSVGLPRVGGDQIVLALAYDPLDHALYAGTTDGVYRLGSP